jgi:hypothetical protein
MAKLKLVLFLAAALSLATPGLAAAEGPAEASVAEHLVTTFTARHIPPGASYVQKWTLEQLPGKVFETRADAIAAGFNANLMRMDIHKVTIIVSPQAEALAQNL